MRAFKQKRRNKFQKSKLVILKKKTKSLIRRVSITVRSVRRLTE